MRYHTLHSRSGFSLVEMIIGILVLGVVFIAVASVFILFQKGAARTGEHAEAQQNARVALEFVTDALRQAGSHTDYFRGQRPIVFAGPYQIAVNADIDNGRTIDGNAPLGAINTALSPDQVPASGTAIYQPRVSYQTGAETVVLTLDSNNDGIIDGRDRGDDPEESGRNTNLFMLRRVVYGFDGTGSNDVRESNLALVRGPNLSPTWNVPQPLFAYFYDHDADPATADRLWGDLNSSGVIESNEALLLTPVPDNFLAFIRRIDVTAVSESKRYDSRFETNGGFLSVALNSQVFVRNSTRAGSLIFGIVYHDVDGDGVREDGETGLYNVEVGLAGTSRSVRTDNYGAYYLPLPGGSYSVQEIDPPGYVSTTGNLVAVTIAAGQTQVVNFGDRSNLPIGAIRGCVFSDDDRDGVKAVGESGIEGVVVTLDNGSQAATDAAGAYLFMVPKGNYTVVEVDPVGFSSTTPNSATAVINTAADTITVNFGDYNGGAAGTLEGYVYLDTNEDGILSGIESGIPNVTVKLSTGDSTVTNARGYYSFTLTPGVYEVTERDPIGYTSTTVNTFVNVLIVADTVVVRNFGDVLENRQDFVEIHISHTDRALSVNAVDLGEDDKQDPDIVLGTALGSVVGNVLVFLNRWESVTTPIDQLFESEPTYRRDAVKNVNAMCRYDFSRDGTPDLLTGLDDDLVPNLQIWHTGSGGVLNSTPDASYSTSSSTVVMDGAVADLNADGMIDLVVALKSSLIDIRGGFEIFKGTGAGTFSSHKYFEAAGSMGDIKLGAIWAVDVGDVDGDGDGDIVIGSHSAAFGGTVDIYLNDGSSSGDFVWSARYLAPGAVNDLKLVDMMEDDGGDLDIVAGTSTGGNAGGVCLWLNTSGVFGMPDTTGYAFGPEETANWPDDWVNGEGEVLSLGVIHVNNDLFPDIAFGTRNSILYTGNLYVLPAYGTLPPSGWQINTTVSGEVITLDIADFNKDRRPDIVVGTRTSPTAGRLVAYFGREL